MKKNLPGQFYIIPDKIKDAADKKFGQKNTSDKKSKYMRAETLPTFKEWLLVKNHSKN